MVVPHILAKDLHQKKAFFLASIGPGCECCVHFELPTLNKHHNLTEINLFLCESTLRLRRMCYKGFWGHWQRSRLLLVAKYV